VPPLSGQKPGILARFFDAFHTHLSGLISGQNPLCHFCCSAAFLILGSTNSTLSGGFQGRPFERIRALPQPKLRPKANF
jgi:hypothetical protein